MLTPDELREQIAKVRVSAVVSDEVFLPPMAEQYYLLAVAALEQAERFATLASYHEMQKT